MTISIEITRPSPAMKFATAYSAAVVFALALSNVIGVAWAML